VREKCLKAIRKDNGGMRENIVIVIMTRFIPLLLCREEKYNKWRKILPNIIAIIGE
jgi:hypothetical protein